MESVFAIVAEPNRARFWPCLIPTLGWRDRAEAADAQPAVSKHLRVLRDAGFVEATVEHSADSTGSSRSRFGSWMIGWRRSAGSGPITWMRSSAISTAWISRITAEEGRDEDEAAETANMTPEN